MEKINAIKKLLDEIQFEEGSSFVVDKEALLSTYQNPEAEQPGLAIKLLSVFGGFLASLALFGFMGIAGVFDSDYGILAVGIGAILFAWVLNKSVDKLIFDTFSVSIFIIGVVSLAFGLLNLNLDENIVTFIIIVIAATSLYVMQNYVLSFVSTVTIGGCLLILIIANDLYNFVHLYVAFYAAIMGYWFLNEAKIIKSRAKLSLLYSPIRIGIIISFLFGLIALGVRDLMRMDHNYIWISSILISAGVLLIVYNIMEVVKMRESKHRSAIYGLIVLFLLPTIFCPSISGAILIILLSFLVNYKTGFVIGIVALVYFVSQYYYDLNFTLLTKSIILISSGIVLLAFYFFIHKILKENEEV
ncbi:DUF4401 domain-containing protein [Flagellimonas sp. S3867]|uniref:DUF4401 domain-containing protein n=1 Tax=Flagellimonas sp. S3867 TaxID=2768063 RepID=UPI001683F76A|nr:DUF4401 domain-containing protein [Flagellimonas sp. S3867]